jgi:hypothetical protein
MRAWIVTSAALAALLNLTCTGEAIGDQGCCPNPNQYCYCCAPDGTGPYTCDAQCANCGNLICCVQSPNIKPDCPRHDHDGKPGPKVPILVPCLAVWDDATGGHFEQVTADQANAWVVQDLVKKRKWHWKTEKPPYPPKKP